MARLTIRIDFESGDQLGPGKIKLLELVAETGSIRKAASAMKMSYRKAWLLLQALETAFRRPLVKTVTGGRAGGGGSLTPLGQLVAAQYRAIEGAASKAATANLSALDRLFDESKSKKSSRRKS